MGKEGKRNMKKTYYEIQIEFVSKNRLTGYQYLEKHYDSKEEAIKACKWEIEMDKRNHSKPNHIDDIIYSVNEIEYDEEDSYEYPSSVVVGTYNKGVEEND